MSENNATKAVKKPIYKKWWFWVIIVLVISAIGGVNNVNDKNSSSGNVETGNTTYSIIETTTTEKTKSPKEIKKEYINSCKTITFDKLGRNPNKYKGEKFKITGEVIQVQEGWGDSVDLRINMTKTTYEYIDEVTWSDTIYATVEIGENEDKILENDIITIYGECEGDYTYESIMGSNVTLPKINVEYFKIGK